MIPTETQIAERMPIWEALSEFFLDTQLQQEDYGRIAAILAGSAYSETELDDILNYEIYPACSGNLMSIAGEWSAFHPDWIKDKVAPLYGRRPILNLSFLRRWTFSRNWTQVRSRIAVLRGLSNTR